MKKYIRYGNANKKILHIRKILKKCVSKHYYTINSNKEWKQEPIICDSVIITKGKLKGFSGVVVDINEEHGLTVRIDGCHGNGDSFAHIPKEDVI